MKDRDGKTIRPTGPTLTLGSKMHQPDAIAEALDKLMLDYMVKTDIIERDRDRIRQLVYSARAQHQQEKEALDEARNVLMVNTDDSTGTVELDLTGGQLLTTLRKLAAAVEKLDTRKGSQ